MTPCSAVREALAKYHGGDQCGLKCPEQDCHAYQALSLPPCREGELREALEEARPWILAVAEAWGEFRAYGKNEPGFNDRVERMEKAIFTKAPKLIFEDGLSSPPRSPEEAKP